MGGYGSGRPQQLGSLGSLYCVRAQWFRSVFRSGDEFTGHVPIEDGTQVDITFCAGRFEINCTLISLEQTCPHFGGSRSWFACPLCHGRTSVLYGRQREWACRRCWRANYSTQKEVEQDRLFRKAHRLRKRLGDTNRYAPMDHAFMAGVLPVRPHRMHRRTYERLTNELVEVETRAAELFNRQMNRIMSRLEASERIV